MDTHFHMNASTPVTTLVIALIVPSKTAKTPRKSERMMLKMPEMRERMAWIRSLTADVTLIVGILSVNSEVWLLEQKKERHQSRRARGRWLSTNTIDVISGTRAGATKATV